MADYDANVLKIWNQALALAKGRSRILALNDTGEAAYQCGLFYDEVRLSVLRAARWSFASVNSLLEVVQGPGVTTANDTFDVSFSSDFAFATAPVPAPWVYAFAYPSDAIAVSSIWPVGVGCQQSPLPFRVDNLLVNFVIERVILTNYSSPSVVYIRDILDPRLWDASFTTAIIHGLAAQLAQTLSGDLKLAQQRLQIANDAIMQARLLDANQDTDVIDHTPDWIRVRDYYNISGLDQFWTPYGPLLAL